MATLDVQSAFLEALVSQQIPVTLFLKNGVRMSARIRHYDTYCIVMEVDGKQQMVMKQVVSTIVPDKKVNWQTNSL